MTTKRKYPEGASPDVKRQIDNLSDLSAYAYGFSDEKPGWSYWLIFGGLTAFAVGKILMWW